MLRYLLGLSFAVGFGTALADIVVNTATDEDTSNASCSLHEAIMAVNSQGNYNGCVDGDAIKTWSKITFAIAPNAGEVQTITLVSALPDIVKPVFIDATTQSGSECTPLPNLRVVVSGNNSHGGPSFETGSAGSKLHGMTILDAGVALNVNSDNFTVGCTILGMDAAATTAHPNGYGISVAGKNATIGEASASAWFPNVISANAINVNLLAGGDNALIAGNYIGVDATGLIPQVGSYSVLVQASGARIGTGFSNGPHSHQRNVIGITSGGPSVTSIIVGSISNTIIAGNYIGVGADGETVLPIGIGSAILINGANTLLGCNGLGSWDDCRNVIVNPDYSAVTATSTATATSIVSNFINVGADGVTTYPSTGNTGAVVISADSLVARNVIGTVDSHVSISLTAPNYTGDTNRVFLNGVPTFAGGGILSSSDNCFANPNSIGVDIGIGPTEVATPATFVRNWWGAADGPGPSGAGADADAAVSTSPFRTAKPVYCGFDHIFGDGFDG